MINYEQVLEQFRKFVNEFDVKDSQINLKINHSYYVADLAMKLAKRLDLDEEEVMLAKVIGLMHDMGRFMQYQKTHKYSDIKTKIDHANLAVNYLFQENHIADFLIDKKYYEIIRAAIFNHNKLEIEDGLNDKELLFSKIIRDVDKIDIFRVIAVYFDFKYDSNLTKEVREEFEQEKLVNRVNIENKSDDIVSSLSFIYDINFKESFELLNETDNLELYLGVIEVKKELEGEFKRIKEGVRKYLESRLEEC